MSVRDQKEGQTGDSSLVTRVRDALFGDGVGLALFLGGLCVTWLTWHVGFFISDAYTIANTLVNVAEGHLFIDHLRYSLTLGSQPGLHIVDSRLYGRNYGQVFLSLPVYYVLDLTERAVDTRLLVPGLWTLLVLAFVRQVGEVTERRRVALAAGSVCSVVLLLTNLFVVAPFEDDLTGIVALQVVSTTAVAATGVLLYRTLSRHCEQRVAVTTGAGIVVATPLWFWAGIPKRHVLTAAGVAALLFLFHSSRESNSLRRLGLRALGYVVAGMIAWVHVFEGVALLVAFGTADFATARRTGGRELLVVALALAVALSPFVATNVAISGDPLEPPRLTPFFDPEEDQGVELGPGGTVVRTDENVGATGNGSSGVRSDSGSGHTEETDQRARITEAIGRTIRRGDRYVSRTVAALETAPTRLYHTYVRSGRIEFGVNYKVTQQEAIDLTLLESSPVLVGVVSGIVLGLRRARRRLSIRGETAEKLPTFRRIGERVRTARPETQTGGFALGIVACFGIMYLSYLPLHSQITVRYVLPMVPALGYLVAQTTPVRRVIREQTRTLAVSYVLLVVVGTILVVVGFPLIDPAIGEAMQLHALVNLGTAIAAGGLLTGDALGVNVDDRVLAAGLALPAAATTVLVGFMQLAYFEYGVYAIPLVRPIAESLALLS